MDHVRIFKELHSLACLLEDNGKFIESSQITNVMTRIAQGTAPTGNTGAGTGATQFTREQLRQNIKNRLNELLQLRTLANTLRSEGPADYTGAYTIDTDGYKIFTKDSVIIGSTLQDLAKKVNKQVPALGTKKNDYADKIAYDILSAANWEDPQGDAAITKKINEVYEIGYNLLAGTYYIGHKTNKSDVVDKKNVNDLEIVFQKLGEHYKKHNNQFPLNIYQAFGKSTPELDVNKIITEILERETNDKFDYMEKTYQDHSNYEEIKRGFIIEHNKRQTDPNKLITERNSANPPTDS
jgi:hypothetical protein